MPAYAQTPGEQMRNAESGMRQTMTRIIDNYYAARDLDTAQAIRGVRTDTEAAEIVAQLRRGRWQEVLLLAASGAAGVATGVMAQKTVDVRVVGAHPARCRSVRSDRGGRADPHPLVRSTRHGHPG